MVDDALLALDDEERLEKRRSYQCPGMLLYFPVKKAFQINVSGSQTKSSLYSSSSNLE